jgi:F-type H+-transporting ATPase subunit delta
MSLAKIYAQALFDAAKEDPIASKNISILNEDLEAITTSLFSDSSKKIKKLLIGPTISYEKKVEMIGAISGAAKFSKLLKDFLTLLIKKNRLPHLRTIQEAFFRVECDSRGFLWGELSSAEPLNQEMVRDVETLFAKKLNAKVLLKTVIDPSIIAGIKVRIQGKTYDTTLTTRLKTMRDGLESRAEIH